MTFEQESTSEFDEDFSKLDKSIKDFVWKKINRILENPLLSKPLEHSVNMFSERIKNFRIVFKIENNRVIFYKIRKRDDAY